MIALALWLVSLVVVGYAVLIAAYLAAFVVLGILAVIGAPFGLVIGLSTLALDARRNTRARRERPTEPRPEVVLARCLGQLRYTELLARHR